MSGEPLAVEVRDLRKSFRIPSNHSRSRGSRLLHPVERDASRELQVLNGISFSVAKGEFFGIVGRNGSGKSTLLRTLSSIYRVDGGTVRVAGRIAPLIELGVGFEPELSARENVVLNGVILGMSPGDVRRKADEVLEFAEVRQFADVALKNFSSGMRVRLAFATMVQADPHILLVDEILAVGDAGFREKCTQTFLKLKAAGKTIVLVTHTMQDVQLYCDRAMLLEAGRIAEIGDPTEVTRRYFEVALQHRERGIRRPGIEKAAAPDPAVKARIAELRLSSSNGAVQAVVDEGAPLEIEATVRVERPIRAAGLRLEIRTEHGARVFAPSDSSASVGVSEFEPGQRMRAAASIENRLSPGRYTLFCAVLHAEGDEERVAASPVQTLTFEVGGLARPGAGLVSLDHTVRIEGEEPESQS